MFAILEWGGAVGVLAAFALSQTGAWPTAGLRYQAINLVSGVGLTVAGVAVSQWGFVTLNGAWAVISAYGLFTHRHDLQLRRVPSDPG